jgi:hypothetical protein
MVLQDIWRHCLWPQTGEWIDERNEEALRLEELETPKLYKMERVAASSSRFRELKCLTG